MSKNIYWAPVDIQTGEVWAGWIMSTKAGCREEVKRTSLNTLAYNPVKVMKIQITVLPQKKRKK